MTPHQRKKILSDLHQLRGVGPDSDWAPGEIPSCGEILPILFSKLRMDDRLAYHALATNWQSLVGEWNARHSHPESVQRHVLHVKVNSSSALFHIRILKADLLRKIQTSYPKLQIQDLRFKL